jgi:hypothetical protein
MAQVARQKPDQLAVAIPLATDAAIGCPNDGSLAVAPQKLQQRTSPTQLPDLNSTKAIPHFEPIAMAQLQRSSQRSIRAKLLPEKLEAGGTIAGP